MANVISLGVSAKGRDLALQQPVSLGISGDGAISRRHDLVNPNDKTRWRFIHSTHRQVHRHSRG